MKRGNSSGWAPTVAAVAALGVRSRAAAPSATGIDLTRGVSRTARAIVALEATLVPDEACGAAPINGLLRAARRHGMQAELVDLQLRWCDYWLKGIENGVLEEPPLRIFVMGLTSLRRGGSRLSDRCGIRDGGNAERKRHQDTRWRKMRSGGTIERFGHDNDRRGSNEDRAGEHPLGEVIHVGA